MLRVPTSWPHLNLIISKGGEEWVRASTYEFQGHTIQSITIPSASCYCCRKGDTFQGLRVGSCLTLRSELSKETHMLTKQETLWGRGSWAESSRVREPRRTAWPCTWLALLGFMVVGLVSWLFLANRSDSGSFLVAHSLLSQDRFQWEGFWEVGRTYGLASPLSFWPFLNSPCWW